MEDKTDWEEVCPGSTKSRTEVRESPPLSPLEEYKIGRARALKMYERFGWRQWMAKYAVGPDGGMLRIRRSKK